MSVLLRTKDRPDLLAEALASLRAQTFGDFETVLVNDGSPVPETSLFPVHGRAITVVKPPAPGGRSRALNAGLAAAHGSWIAYLDDDDVFLPGHLASLDAARAAGARAAHTSVRQIRQARDAAGVWRDARELRTYDRPLDAGRLLYKNEVPLIGVAHERGLAAEAGGFDESFDMFEDWDFLIRLARLAPVVHVPEVTALYRVRAGSSVTEVVPWGSPAAQEARRRLYAKHAAGATPDAMIAFVDEAVGGLDAALGRERFLVNALDALRAERDAAAGRAAGLESELEALKSESTRFREESATREQALAVRNAELDAEVAKREETLRAIYRSRTWRLLSPWWKLKERLKS